MCFDVCYGVEDCWEVWKDCVCGVDVVYWDEFVVWCQVDCWLIEVLFYVVVFDDDFCQRVGLVQKVLCCFDVVVVEICVNVSV